MYRISPLARKFGLSRSTLLYYDRIGLLSPSGRSKNGYRLYGEADAQRLGEICRYRRAGLPLRDIQKILTAVAHAEDEVLRRRMHALDQQIRDLHCQQRVLAGLLAVQAGIESPSLVDKDMWVAMMRGAGLDDQGMRRWHAEFERRAPERHHAFLVSLGISEEEIRSIRQWSAAG